MRFVSNFAAAAAAICVLAGASAASATVGVATFTGTLGFNGGNAAATGLFGPAAGAAFIAVYTFDTALGYHELVPGNREVNYGGSVYPLDTPILSASLTINGVTRAFSGSVYGNAQTFNHGDRDEILWVATGADGSQLLNYFQTAPGVMGGDFSRSFDVSPSGPYAPGGIPNVNFLGNYGRFTLNGQNDVYLKATHLTVEMQLAPTASVPEPATWAMMLMGFGGLGTLLRRRRAGAFAAPA